MTLARLSSVVPVLGLSAILLGCPTEPTPAPSAAQPSPSTSASASAQESPPPGAPAANARPEFVSAPDTGDVIEQVKAEHERASADDKTLLVYVGASWCEPCQYFHAAVDEGEFDTDLAGVRLLEFDLDRDRDRLVAAGYTSKMIPLFIAPRPDGRPGPRRTEGGIKGPNTVDHLRKRLLGLVVAARADQG